jgi:hypothetical protein
MLDFTKRSIACLVALSVLRDGLVTTALAQPRVPTPYRPGPTIPGGGGGGDDTFAAILLVAALGILIFMTTVMITEHTDNDSAPVRLIGLAAAFGVPIAALMWFRPAVDAIVDGIGFFGVVAFLAAALVVPRLIAARIDKR